jgi:endonuclease/exonuclease/phosphatase family metal-dependent hydrolase
MKTLYSLILLFFSLQQHAQLRVLSYNLLNFPTGNLAGRLDTLANIIDYTRPHLLMIQELKTAEGLDDITDMMNDLGYGDFTHPGFVPQQSPGSPLNLLQQSIVYDAEVLRLKSSSVVLTDYRDINEYVMYLNDPQLPNGSDTTFLYVYVTHLKSSTGTENEQSRLSMVNSLIDHFETLPEDSHVLFAGDFNLYTNQEPAYLAITSEDNAIVLRDIFSGYGDWTGSSFAHKEILTQSTRSSVIFDDGAGGGVDDRFDFILISESLMNPDNSFHYEAGSYRSVGNNGMCYNQSITACSTLNEVPADVLQSIYYMSDHIPQYCEFFTDLIDHTGEIIKIGASLELPFGNIFQDEILFKTTRLQGMNSEIQLMDLQGRILQSLPINNNGSDHMSCSQVQTGIYLLSLTQEGTPVATHKVLIQR